MTLADLQNPSTPIEVAHALVPFGAPQSEVVQFPEDVLLAFLECTEDAVGGEVVILGAGVVADDPLRADAFAEQQIVASDCAFANGLDEYAPIWTPPTQSDLNSMLNSWLEAVDLCFASVGIDEYPTTQAAVGLPEPDFAGAIAQDPSIEEPLRSCMREQGEEFPGDEFPLE